MNRIAPFRHAFPFLSWGVLAACTGVTLLFTGCKPEEPVRPAPPPPGQPESTKENRKQQRSQENKRRRDRVADAARRGGVVFQRGAYSPQQADPGAPPPARAMLTLDASQKATLAGLIEQLKTPVTRDTALQIASQTRDLISPDAIPLLAALLKYPDKDVRGIAMASLLGTQDKLVLPVIDLALADAEPDVRIQAIEATGQIVDPATAPVLTKAFADKDSSVRQLALQSAMKQAPETRNALLAAAIASPEPDLAQVGLGFVESQSSKDTIALMMEGLDHPDPLIREKAHDALYLIMHQDFKQAAQARTWWTQNKGLFDDNLVIIDTANFPGQ